MKTRPTRRGFLEAALLAGAGAALGRAAQESRPRSIPARFIGDAFERGHHWITPDPEKLHVDRREKTGVVIVGGGIAGAAAAWRLREASVEDFALLELEDKAGGLARGGLMGSSAVPFGGVTMRVPDASTSTAVWKILFEASGVERFDRTPALPAIYERGAWQAPVYVDPELAGLFDRLRKVGASTESRLLVESDATSVADWLRAERFPAKAVGFARRRCLTRFGARLEDVSAAAFAVDLMARSPGGALVIPGGFSTVLAPLIAKLGPRMLPARVAVLVRPSERGVIVRAVNAEDAVVTDFEAKAAVLAVPPFIASRICPVLRERRRDLVIPEPGAWLVSAIKVSAWPKGFDPSIPFHQCPDERATLILHVGAPPDAVIVTYRPFPAAAVTPARMFLRDLDPESARDWVFRELASVFPDLPALATQVEFCRVGHGAIRPGPKFMTEIAPKLRVPVPPIHPCGADYSGLPGFEAAIEEGVRGAEAVLERLGKLDKSWL